MFVSPAPITATLDHPAATRFKVHFKRIVVDRAIFTELAGIVGPAAECATALFLAVAAADLALPAQLATVLILAHDGVVRPSQFIV